MLHVPNGFEKSEAAFIGVSGSMIALLLRDAAELHLTQSASSRQIAQIEALLGRSLFVREHRAFA